MLREAHVCRISARAGLAAGTVGAVATARLLRGLLFGIGPISAPVHAVVAIVMLAVATLASWLPARRAARTDKPRVLRME